MNEYDPSLGISDIYVSQALNTPLLKRGDEQDLAIKIQKWQENPKAGESTRKAGKDAREKIILANLRLVVNIAKKYRGRMDFMDLVSEGNAGLTIAAGKYKAGVKSSDGTLVKFSTYASFWIKQSILRAIANKSSLIRLPTHYLGKTKRVFDYIEDYKEKFKEEPSVEEISEKLKISAVVTENIVFSRKGLVYINEKVGEEEGIERESLISDTLTLTPYQEAEKKDSYLELCNLMKERLSRREREILKLRFGFGLKDRNTLESIGKKYKVTRERIRQIESRAFRKLRLILESRQKHFAKFLYKKA